MDFTDYKLKQEIKQAIQTLTDKGLADVLDPIVDFNTIQVQDVEDVNLEFEIRIMGGNSNKPRYFYVKISEAQLR